MRKLIRLMAALSAVFVVASPVLAGMAVIETTAPLSERSDEAVKMAVMSAVQSAVKGAAAMGLSRVAVKGVQVLPRLVVVQILATDAGSNPGATESEQEDLQPPNDPKPSSGGRGEIKAWER